MLFLYDFYKENLYSESKKRRREVFFRDIMIKSLAEKMKGGGSIMLKYKNILVPYDGSDHAKEALAQAVALAANGDGTKLYIASPDGSVVYGYAIASDTGGALMSGRVLVDLYYNTLGECVNFGRRQMNVYILA